MDFGKGDFDQIQLFLGNVGLMISKIISRGARSMHYVVIAL